MKKWFVLMAICLGCTQAIFAQISLNGFVRPYTAVNLHAPNNYMIMEEKASITTTLSGSDARGVFVLDTWYHHLTQTANWDLTEAYVDLFFENADLRIGKQQVVWGKADGIPINDIVCPWNLQDFILQDFDDIRIGLNMVKANYYFSFVNLEALWVPKFHPMELAQSGPWVFSLPDTLNLPLETPGGLDNLPVSISYHQPVLPADKLGNSEFGFRLYGFNLGFDWALSYLDAWDDVPALSEKQLYASLTPAGMVPDSIGIWQAYNRMKMVGFNFSRPVLTGVLRAEGGYFTGKQFGLDGINLDSTGATIGPFSVTKPYAQYMVGWDQNWKSWLNLSGQYIEQRILDYDTAIQNDEINRLVSLLVRGGFMNETLQYQILALGNLDYEDALMRTMLTYNYSDGVRLILGADFLKAGKNSMTFRQFDFGRFDLNDNAYLKVIYSF